MSQTKKKTVRKNESKKFGAASGILSWYGYKHSDNKVSDSQFKDVKKHFKGRCVYCGKTEEEVKLTREHAIPINQDWLGTSEKGNIVPACEECNSKKSKNHYSNFCRQEAIRGRKAERDITKYMEKMGYKELCRDDAEKDKIRKIINDALIKCGEIRDDAVAQIEKIVNKKQTKKKTTKMKPSAKK